MSAETKQKLEEALQEHITSESGEGRIITDYVTTVAFINLNGEQGLTGYFHEVRGARHSIEGLTVMQQNWLCDGAGNDPDEDPPI